VSNVGVSSTGTDPDDAPSGSPIASTDPNPAAEATKSAAASDGSPPSDESAGEPDTER
jgi:hypothetical protein